MLACSSQANQPRPREEEAPKEIAVPPAPPKGPVSKEELERVRQRAEYIYFSERAAIKATDLFMEREDVDRSKLNRFLVVPREGFWYVLFGWVSDFGTFAPVYAYRAPRQEPEKMEIVSVEKLPGDFHAVSRAVKTAVEIVFKAHGRGQVNPTVIEEKDELIVYVMQGSHVAGVTVLGGDYRFRFSKDGRKILEESPLHTQLIGVDVRVRADEYAGAIHTHVLFPGPLETELAMLRLFPEMRTLIVGDPRTGYVYKLLPDGSIETMSLEELERRTKNSPSKLSKDGEGIKL
jgi:hypothetical protein